MNKRIFGDDRITINSLYTFKKSDINGIYSEHYRSSLDGRTYMQLAILVNGQSIVIDKKKYKRSISERENELIEYHRGWEETLSNICDNIQERKMI